MTLDLNWINLLILFGALQGLIFSVILFLNRKHPGAKFLGWFMVVLSYNGFETFNWSSGLNLIFFDLFPFIVIFASGPSLYFYLFSLLYPEQKINRRQIWAHFGLVIFQFAVRSFTIVMHFLEINKITATKLTHPLDSLYHFYSEPLSVIIFISYLTASLQMYRKASSRQLRALSKEGQHAFHPWIKALLFCVIVLAIAWPLTVIAPYVFDVETDSHYYPIELGLVFFIYWIAMVGYHRTKLIYLKSPKVTDALAQELYHQLQQAVESGKLYLDPELNLSKTSTLTGIPAKTISAVLNQYRETSFNDFINEYRVREVREKLGDSGKQHLTISGIALESGFNSQATFQRAFKNSTGVSPREYLNGLQLKKNGLPSA